MKYVEVIVGAGSAETVRAAAERVKALDVRLGPVGPDGLQAIRLLVTDNQVQRLLDLLQGLLGAQPSARILVLAVEASLPPPDEEARKKRTRPRPRARRSTKAWTRTRASVRII